tara:strand:+ start:190 stop:717 length:528 start_codon:yes stop_codon:yes gene_type:complete
MADDGEEYGVPLLNRLKTGYSACVYQPLASLEGDCATGESDMAYWLMKSEPDEYGWDDLLRDGSTEWTGVRNHAAAKHLRAMKKDDRAFFYHSAIAQPCIVGIMAVAREWQPDGEEGKWASVKVTPVEPLPAPVTLKAMKAEGALSDMATLKQSRLSVSPVRVDEWKHLLRMAGV